MTATIKVTDHEGKVVFEGKCPVKRFAEIDMVLGGVPVFIARENETGGDRVIVPGVGEDPFRVIEDDEELSLQLTKSKRMCYRSATDPEHKK